MVHCHGAEVSQQSIDTVLQPQPCCWQHWQCLHHPIKDTTLHRTQKKGDYMQRAKTLHGIKETTSHRTQKKGDYLQRDKTLQ
jgi:hypothetical protein